jgi:hypothetical protein
MVDDDPVALLDRFEAYDAPLVVKWVNVGTI